MRRPLTFECEGATLAGMAHPAVGKVGVLIVTGGRQTRAGSHRGFVDLADRLAQEDHPCFRFDRRGVGDSDGDDPGFRGSVADIGAALAAFRREFPQMRQVVGWGLCDGASALALHGAALGLDGLILANPWTRDSDDAVELPPRAAVAARYRDRLTDPRQWGRVLRGDIDWRKAMAGLLRVARPEPVPALAQAVADGLVRFDRPILILLAGRDATAQAFASLWGSPTFDRPRSRPDIDIGRIADATHTFARSADAAAMAAWCTPWLAARG